MDLIPVANRYLICAKLGTGGFGEVFVATEPRTGTQVAVKLEPRSSPNKCIAREIKAYAQLGAWPAKQTERFPALHWYGLDGDFCVLVTELLGPSLDSLFQLCSRKFSLKTVLSLADQMLDCVEKVHAAGLVHRDLKPGNFCMGFGGKSSTVQLIDFGLARSWQDPRTMEHAKPSGKRRRGVTGTPPFVSLNAHRGLDQTRRDDLEALGYILIFFLRGGLPWLGAKRHTIMNAKCSTSVESLCFQHPQEFAAYLTYCRSLGFSDLPDYAYLRSLFRGRFRREGFGHDHIYDWHLLKLGGALPDHRRLVSESCPRQASETTSTRTAPSCSNAALDCGGTGSWSVAWDDVEL